MSEFYHIRMSPFQVLPPEAISHNTTPNDQLQRNNKIHECSGIFYFSVTILSFANCLLRGEQVAEFYRVTVATDC